MPATTDPITFPTFLEGIRRASAAGTHVLLNGNLADLHMCPTANGPFPLPITETVARYFNGLTDPVPTVAFSIADGLRQIDLGDADQRAPRLRGLPAGHDPVEVLPALTTVMRQQRSVVILRYADSYLPAQEGRPPREDAFAIQTVVEWSRDNSVRRTGSLVIVMSPEDRVHSLISMDASGFRTVTVPLPEEPERRQMLEEIRRISTAGPFAPPVGDTSRLARLAGGLRLVDLHRISREIGELGGTFDEAAIRDRKRDAIKASAGGVLEVHDDGPIPDNQFAGLEHVRRYISMVKQSQTLPNGLLLVGPPGTGKSFVVRLIAWELGLTMVSLRTVFEQWVGATERNLERALRVLTTLAPVLVWVDEIDQFLGGGQRNSGQSADGGTSERFLQRLLEFMGDRSSHRGIVWVGTSNRPDALDSAMEDRFGVTLPLIHPSADGLTQLVPALVNQQERQLADTGGLVSLAPMMAAATPSARTLVQVVQRAAGAADARAAGSPITAEDLKEAFIDLRDRVDPVERDFLALTAVNKTTFRSTFPWFNNPNWEPLPYLDGIVVKDDLGDWDLDEPALRRRLSELSAQRASDRWAR